MEKKQPQKGFNNYIRFTGLAFQMAATIIICVFIGRFIDNNREGDSQVFTAIFSIFGVVASIWNLIRSVTKSNE